MSRNQTLARPSADAATAALNDGKTEYAVRPGVMFVNGAPIGEVSTVALTAAEAQFDIALGRIALQDSDEARTWSVPVGGDGGNGGD